LTLLQFAVKLVAVPLVALKALGGRGVGPAVGVGETVAVGVAVAVAVGVGVAVPVGVAVGVAVAVAVAVAVGVGVGEAVGGAGRALKIPFTASVKSSMIPEPVYPVRSALEVRTV
jgi:hypothetical protein